MPPVVSIALLRRLFNAQGAAESLARCALRAGSGSTELTGACIPCSCGTLRRGAGSTGCEAVWPPAMIQKFFTPYLPAVLAGSGDVLEQRRLDSCWAEARERQG